MAFEPTHQAKQDPPPQVCIKIYDPDVGHIAVASADRVERLTDQRDGTLLQGQEKTPVPVYKGYAIVEYENHVYAAMPADDVSAWFEPLRGAERALPSRTKSSRRIDEALPERDPGAPE
jgi:hypothetical protein